MVLNGRVFDETTTIVHSFNSKRGTGPFIISNDILKLSSPIIEPY